MPWSPAICAADRTQNLSSCVESHHASSGFNIHTAQGPVCAECTEAAYAIGLSLGSSPPRNVRSSMVDSFWTETSPDSLVEISFSASDADYRAPTIVADSTRCEIAYMHAASGETRLESW